MARRTRAPGRTGAVSGRPSRSGSACSIRAQGRSMRARLARPNSTSVGSSSTPITSPVGPVRCARSAVDQPEPAPTSRTRSPSRTSRRRSMAATVRGWELVWPRPIWIGPSYAARPRASRGRKPARGVASNASETRSSTLPSVAPPRRTRDRRVRRPQHCRRDQARAALHGRGLRGVDLHPGRRGPVARAARPQPAEGGVGRAGAAVPGARQRRLVRVRPARRRVAARQG